jgi:DnaJ-domain-containing protein 1
MFQQTYERPRRPVRVRLVMTSKTVLDGELLVLREENLAKTLNGPEPFLIFQSGSDRHYLAKTAVESIAESDGEQDALPMIEGGVSVSGRFNSSDPHVLLGVARDASPESIREAYHQLARDFHTDRLASLGLHRELTAYADEILKRINLAYSEIDRAARAAA